MYDEWMKDMPIKMSSENKKIEKVYEGTIEPKKEEKEYPYIIEKLDSVREFFSDGVTFGMREPNLKEIKNKINEIIEVVNIMNRGGRK